MKTFCGRCPARIAILAMTLVFGGPCVGFGNAAPQESKASDALAEDAENCKRIFTKNGCYECHGRESQGSVMTGSRIAPDPGQCLHLSIFIIAAESADCEVEPVTEIIQHW
jgi:hypothetical protein